MVYKPVVKKFLGKDVRVIDVDTNTWIILKDVFSALGRVKIDGTWTDEKKKMLQFLKDIDKICDHETFVVDLGKKRGRGNKSNGNIQEVECLLIETLPIVITQFRPTARKGEDALREWQDFMKWVNELLVEANAHEVILKDKEEQKRISDTITNETDAKMVVVNTQISKMMAELIGVYPDIKKINKDELKIYQPKTTIDLIEVRQEALKIYEQQIIINDDYKCAYDNTLKYMKKIYKI